MEFGVFDHLDRDDQALADYYYEARLQIIEAYDRLGFYAYHVAEHHATPLGMAPSPSVFLAAVAQRTRRLRFGPLVYALPLYHPLRMIEEICMLDQMSGGRLEIGFGRGSSPIELIYYGQDPDKSQRIYAEALELVVKGLTQRTPDLPRRVLPISTTCRWSSSRCRSRIRRSGTACTRPTAPSGRRARACGWSVSTRRAKPASRSTASGRLGATRTAAPLPLMGLGRFIVVAETDAAALAIARRAYPRWHASFTHLRRKHNRINAHPRPPTFDELAAVGQGVAGAPDTVTAFLRRQIEVTGSNYLWSASSCSAICRLAKRCGRSSCSRATSCRNWRRCSAVAAGPAGGPARTPNDRLDQRRGRPSLTGPEPFGFPPVARCLWGRPPH